MKDCRVLECPVHRVSLAEAGKLILDAVRTGGRCRVASLNPEIAINAGGKSPPDAGFTYSGSGNP